MKRIAFLALLVAVVFGGILPVFAQSDEPIEPCPLTDISRCPPMPCLECPIPPPPPWVSPQVVLQSHRIEVEIENQVATTRIEQVFRNDSAQMAEGTYLFPLPVGAVVSDLVMFVDGKPIQGRIMGADEARGIYEEIVRQLRDPALLEYVGHDVIQASVFPIQPNSSVKLEIEYSQILSVENGLVRYVYPLRTDQLSRFPVADLSIAVNVKSNDEIGAVYSPSHRIAVNQPDAFSFRAGYETANAKETSDFTLYYSLADSDIALNLLTYRESANEAGYFLLLVTPPAQSAQRQVVSRDVLIVLDQSGSMFGEKWDQAREAVKFILARLNTEDRFNVITFSTGWRVYANDLKDRSEAVGAAQWLDTLEAAGGTDINGGLSAALDMADSERQNTIIFLSDGLATEGETETSRILNNVRDQANPNTRIFTFGVGDDVDTFLLDSLSQEFRGAGSYVRPNENIEAEVSALYSKVSAPVLTDIALEFIGDVIIEDMYPSAPLPDLFIGSQLLIAGRYRNSGTVNFTLTGKVNQESQTFTYPGLEFPENAGGEATLPRLWAARKIGALLNSIRLHGENPELVDSIVQLSVRYGIITPYTSFLIQEEDIFTQAGREEASSQTAQSFREANQSASGAAAVDAADSSMALREADAAPAPMPMDTSGAPSGSSSGFDDDQSQPQEVIKIVGSRTFYYRGETWIDSQYQADEMQPTAVIFASTDYFALLAEHADLAAVLALGERVIVVVEGEAYEIKPE